MNEKNYKRMRVALCLMAAVLVILIVLVVLLLKWTIPSTAYEGCYFDIQGAGAARPHGRVVSVTDMPGNKIRIVYYYDGMYSVCEVDEDSVTFEKPKY